MILSPSAPRFRRGGERLGETAGLVELDVHRVVARGQAAERGAVMHQLVGADRDDAGDVLQGCVVAGGQRLLDELDACRLRRIEQALEVGGAPRLVGIGDEPRLGHGGADGGEPRLVAVAAKLELEQRIARGLARPGRHLLRGAERDGEGGLDGMQRRKSCKLGRASSRALRLEVPQRAVERIARGASRQQGLKPGAVQCLPRWPARKPRWPAARPPRSRHSGRRGRIRLCPGGCRRRWSPPPPRPRASRRARW